MCGCVGVGVADIEVFLCGCCENAVFSPAASAMMVHFAQNFRNLNGIIKLDMDI